MTFVLSRLDGSRNEIKKYGMHTVSGLPGMGRVELMMFLFWDPHIDFFPEQRGLKEYVGEMQARKRDTWQVYLQLILKSGGGV